MQRWIDRGGLSVKPGRAAALVALALALAIVASTPALAASPLKIREVFPGSVALGAGAEFVELQMTADVQNDIDGQELKFYDAAGSLVGASTFVIPSDVANGGSQRTVLFATAAAAALGGGASSPDFTLSSLDRMSPAGGAVCLTGALPADCVTWGPGSFLGLADPQSTNAAAIADGSSLTRSIAQGCSTWLDGPDDSGASATDFASAGPTPRSNATVPTEVRCAPSAAILNSPADPSKNPSATFTFAEIPNETTVNFQCELDGDGSFSGPETTSCDSGTVTYDSLADGQHVFRVRAKGENPAYGPADEFTWTVDTTAPQTSVLSGPSASSSNVTASFTYASNEPNSTFRCQLDEDGIQSCPASGMTYAKLIDGPHSFRVWATDSAGNADATAAVYDFTTNKYLDDRTPPDTSILLSPSSSSRSATAFFAYESSESPATFQCRLDGGPFASCSDIGVTYERLRNGSHTFAVRAVDRAGNADPTPAAYTWQVAAEVPNTKITKGPRGKVRLKGSKKRAKVAFGFTATKPGSTFRCRLDKRPFKRCRSPYRASVKAGRHTFQVYAVDSIGNPDPTPAKRSFRVLAPGR